MSGPSRSSPSDDPEAVPVDVSEEAVEAFSERTAPSPPPRKSPRIGLRLCERYRILELLGEGGTAEVFLAEDEAQARRVVVKWLTARAVRDVQIRERFILGGRAAMAVRHPSVARVESVEQPEGVPPFLVMEELRGESMAEYLEREGPMPERLVLSLAHAAATGLLAAHDAGIIHRDIKPANLFLSGPRGAPDSLKLIDFGFAKDQNTGVSGPSSENVVMGTGQYMAPEQVLADPVDARTDIYALGVVLFRMLSGHLPFDVELGIDLLSHHLFSPAPPVSWLVETVDPQLERVVTRCMRKHPENRYPSTRDLLIDLTRLMQGNRELLSETAQGKLARDPDLYKPRNPKGRGVAEYLAVYFGSEPPPPASVPYPLAPTTKERDEETDEFD